MSVSWLEWIADPKRRALTKNTKVLGALYWLEVADHQLQENPEAPDWLEGLAECCLSLSLAFEDSERLNGIEVSIALLNALDDIRNGLQPDWMTPATLPPSGSRLSSRDGQLRGVLVEAVQVLQGTFGYTEREACRAVIHRLRSRTNATAEALRGWVRSGNYGHYADLVDAVGVPVKETPSAWLEATVRAFDILAVRAGAKPLRR